MGTIDLLENVFCVSYELRLVKLLKSEQCVFFVRCELRVEKQLRTSLISVCMKHVVVISYQCFKKTDWSHLDFRILDS